MVLAAAWGAGSINRVLQCFGITVFSLHVLHQLLARLHGFGNLVVYGSDPDFRSHILPILLGGSAVPIERSCSICSTTTNAYKPNSPGLDTHSNRSFSNSPKSKLADMSPQPTRPLTALQGS